MKYNTTYTPHINLKETVKFTDEIRNKIFAFFNKNYKLMHIIAPTSFPESDSVNYAELENSTRAITFDTTSEFMVGLVSLSDTPYLRQMISKLELKKSEGLYSENNFIWRDLPESPVSSISKHEITMQVVMDDKKSNEVRDAAADLYDLFFAFAQEAKRRYDVPNIFPPYAMFINGQMLENEFADKDFKEREIEMVMEKDAFIFENPGATLLSGHTHTFIPGSLYCNDNHYQIILKDRVNSYVLKVATVAEVAMGEKLAEQIVSNVALKQSKEYIAFGKSNVRILEIKINLPRLVMAISGKGHISEVQPGVYTAEEKVVKSRYKIETY